MWPMHHRTGQRPNTMKPKFKATLHPTQSPMHRNTLRYLAYSSELGVSEKFLQLATAK
jgi:hypothetical protein